MKRSTRLWRTVSVGGLLVALVLGSVTRVQAHDDNQRTIRFSKDELGKLPKACPPSFQIRNIIGLAFPHGPA